MDKVAIDDVRSEINPMEVHDVRKPVSKVLGTEHFAMNYFELAPGDSFSGGLHTHHDQEEVFYVESGTAEFEVGRDRETVTVEAGELIRFEPGEFQTGGALIDLSGYLAAFGYAVATGLAGLGLSWFVPEPDL